jgi:3beta-hydroxy-delta5-steroid dehydrogenase/steroid delta-isomerase
MSAPIAPITRTTCLVTGAAGFLGRHLVGALVARGCRVKALDLAPIAAKAPEVIPVTGDITCRADVDRAMEGVEVVFHTAARIMTAEFAPRAVKESVRAVNVEGTRNVVEGAIAAGVSRLVHTSSAGVCFGERAGGDESLPFSRNTDVYTITKIEAEQVALAANGRGSLLVGAVRPGGIYGPGERNVLTRPVLEQARLGRRVAVIGDGRSRLDYTFVDNLVDAEIRVAERLVRGSPVCGQKYFVSDDQPINHGEWGRRLLDGMGITRRTMHLPRTAMVLIALGMERVYQLAGKPEPKLTRLHVRTCTVDAWYEIGKARRELGYVPLINTYEGLRRCVPDALELYHTLPPAPADQTSPAPF